MAPTALHDGGCVLVLGYGPIGRALVTALRSPPSCVSLVNATDPFVPDAFPVDVLAEPEVIRNYSYVINTIPIHKPEMLVPLLVACAKYGVHYLDTNEDREVGRYVKLIASAQHDVLFAPHCGLAPGMINVMGAWALRKTNAEELDLRVGALTGMVDNEFMYTPTWSPVGLVNQSLGDFDMIELGRAKTYKSVFSREAQQSPNGHFQKFYHDFYIDGVHYECFPTSGGLGTMTQLADNKIRWMLYRSIRLHKHSEAMRSLIHGFGFDLPTIAKKLNEHRVNPSDDFVYTIVRTNGPDCSQRNTWIRRTDAGLYMGSPMTAIQMCTVGGVAAVLDLHIDGKLPSGFLHQHAIDWNDYSASRYMKGINYGEQVHAGI